MHRGRIVVDEPTSMRDHRLRRGMLALMETLRAEQDTAFLFITHDMALGHHFCDRLLVMQDGRLVEEGPADEVALRPRHPHTQALVAAVERAGDPDAGMVDQPAPLEVGRR